MKVLEILAKLKAAEHKVHVLSHKNRAQVQELARLRKARAADPVYCKNCNGWVRGDADLSKCVKKTDAPAPAKPESK